VRDLKINAVFTCNFARKDYALAAVVTAALDNCLDPAIPHAEALRGDATDVRSTVAAAIKASIPTYNLRQRGVSA
jgi:hypothetical protein